jgi:hypothetical protein
MKRRAPHWKVKPEPDTKPFSGRYRGHKVAGENWRDIETERRKIDRYWAARFSGGKGLARAVRCFRRRTRLAKGCRDLLFTVKRSGAKADAT